MRFDPATDIAALAAYLPNFLILAGGERFRKRSVQLARDIQRSVAQAKIVADYHWLEISLTSQMIAVEQRGHLLDRELSPADLAAMYFAGMTVEVYGRLTQAGRTALVGRIRDALQAGTGFAALYFEMDMALRLMGEGFDVGFPDLERRARYDLEFSKGAVEGEVECKSLSADAGRKIHRKHFYRFMEVISPALVARADAGGDDVLLISLEDRLPSLVAQQKLLRAATERLCSNPSLNEVAGEFFSITRVSYQEKLGMASQESERAFYNACCGVFGKDIHVSGAVTEKGICLIVMRSKQEDDHSKPWLQATEEAAKQFSGKRPGFIGVQLNDIQSADLALQPVRQRAEILSGALFFRSDTKHVAATFFAAYGGLVAREKGIYAPGFSVLNPNLKYNIRREDFSPFLGGDIPDDEFARLLGAGALPGSLQ
jgi:hypothetical protein